MNTPDLRYTGGMRVIEALQGDEDLAPLLSTMFQQRRYSGWSEVFIGAVECVVNQFFAFRSKGFSFSHEDPPVDRFLKLPPASMRLEIARLLDGGDSTFNELSSTITALTRAVADNRHLLTFRRKSRVPEFLW